MLLGQIKEISGPCAHERRGSLNIIQDYKKTPSDLHSCQES